MASTGLTYKFVFLIFPRLLSIGALAQGDIIFAIPNKQVKE